MLHVVAPRESLWSIAVHYYGNGAKWSKIATDNGIRDPNFLLAGQKLWLADARPGQRSNPSQPPQQPAMVSTSYVPSSTYVFVLADEIDPFRRKVVRRVIVSEKMVAEASQRVGKPLKIFPNPERFGFSPTQPNSTLSMGNHARGFKPSPFSSASTGLFGATRFTGTPFWIDVARAAAAGATIHETQEILKDLDNILAKTADPVAADRSARSRSSWRRTRRCCLRATCQPRRSRGLGRWAPLV